MHDCSCRPRTGPPPRARRTLRCGPLGPGPLLDEAGIDRSIAADDVRVIDEVTASPLYVAVDGAGVGLLGLTDPIRAEASTALQALRARGIDTMGLLTGDRASVARHVGTQLGIDTVMAEVLPNEKVDAVERLQAKGYTVAVVGDGGNDSPALARADVGIAVNGGADVAQEASDVVLLRGDLEMIPEAIDDARAALALIEQNWRIIAVPNTLALGLTAFGIIGPVAATVISNGAAIVAGGNALRPLFQQSERTSADAVRTGNMLDRAAPEAKRDESVAETILSLSGEHRQ